ncbi:MAG: GGDEF domain-containing protein [Butyrivibrio sp.]|nr:GGDEF domain-containing protein [Muribaculum sp.]MCM1552953.1 GGDEF domain-containing protein [Butyrivibrio sp.]
MEGTMKKVALIMESWMRYFTYAWPSGILQKIKESGLDVNLYIFNSSANWSDDALYNQGEYNIFNLPDLKDFDGIVLDVNNITSIGVRSALVERVRRSGVPTVVLGNYFEGLRSVTVDNYRAMQNVMEHLAGHHGCKSFWFVMGPEDNFENQRRFASVRDYVEAHQLSDSRYYFGDFDCGCGISGFEALYAEYELPDAIVCANDNIAVGVLSAAEKRGLFAPKDFLVTGFDDLDKSRYYDPKISTVSHIREELGYAAMEMLCELWQGQEVEEIRCTGTREIFWDSCGCESDIVIDLKEHLKGNILYGIETEDFEKQLLKLKYSLTRCETVQEMLERIPQCIPSLRCDELYLVTDRRLYWFMGDEPIEEQLNSLLAEEDFLVQGYPEDMQFTFSYTKDGIAENDDQNIAGNHIFPTFECEESGVDFLFLPLHFRDKCVGYFAIRNAVYLMEKQFLFDIINALTTALENLYSRARLRDMNQLLTTLYNRDSMTMLYNRLELDKLGIKYLESQHDRGNHVFVVYLDVDRLKYINDNFGHEQGDFAIKTTAKLIQKHFPKESLCFRLGGDEFLALCSGISEAEINGIYEAIQDELRQVQEQNRCPYELTVSYGHVVTDIWKDIPLADYIKQADDKMYAFKTLRKKQRTE